MLKEENSRKLITRRMTHYKLEEARQAEYEMNLNPWNILPVDWNPFSSLSRRE